MVQQNNQGGGGGKRINVDHATVKRADVTRVNIGGGPKDTADDLLSEISGEGTGSIKSYLSEIRNALKDCCDPTKTGESTKKLNSSIDNLSDTLSDEGKGGTERSKSLGDSLKELNKNIQVLITTVSTGGAVAAAEGGGGGPADGSIGFAEAQAAQKQITALGDAFLTFEKDTLTGVRRATKGWNKTLDDGTVINRTFIEALGTLATDTIHIQGVNAFNSMVEKVQGTISSLTDFDQQLNKTIEILKESMEVTRSGLVTAERFFVDDWNQLWEGTIAIVTGDFEKLGDSMRNTIENLESFREAEGTGIASVLINQTETLDDMGHFMKEARDGIFEGNQLRSMMKDADANAALLDTFALMRRQGIMDDLNAKEVGRKANQRSQQLAIIAANTGLTVEQLIKSNEGASKTFDQLHTMGFINNQQLDNLKAVATMAGPEWADVMAKLIEQRADPTAFKGAYPDLYKDMQKAGVGWVVDELAPILGETSKEQFPAFAEALGPVLSRAAEAVDRRSQSFGRVAGRILNTELTAGLVAGGRMFPQQVKDALDVQTSEFGSVWNSVTSFFNNMFPGGSVGLVVAISALIKATWANTGAVLLSAGKMALIVAGLASAAAAGYAIGKAINWLYEKFSELIGLTGSLGSDLYDLVQEIKKMFSWIPGVETEDEALGVPARTAEEILKNPTMTERVAESIPFLGTLFKVNRMANAKSAMGGMADITGPTPTTSAAPAVLGAPSPAIPGEGTNVDGVEGRLDRVATAIEEGNRYARETAANTKNKPGTATSTGDVNMVAPGSPSK